MTDWPLMERPTFCFRTRSVHLMTQSVGGNMAHHSQVCGGSVQKGVAGSQGARAGGREQQGAALRLQLRHARRPVPVMGRNQCVNRGHRAEKNA